MTAILSRGVELRLCVKTTYVLPIPHKMRCRWAGFSRSQKKSYEENISQSMHTDVTQQRGVFTFVKYEMLPQEADNNI